MAKLILGCGYLGRRVAAAWQAAGEIVHVVTRSPERAHQLAQGGLQPIVADVTQPATLQHLPVADTVLFAVGYDRTAGRSIFDVYVAGLQDVLDALRDKLAPGVSRIIYTSSTGVYGTTSGEWVDEDSPCEPQRDGGRACLAAEQAITAHPLGDQAIILRLAGLYGPGRIPSERALRAGEALAVPSDGHLNLIHVDDAARVVLAAAEHARPPRTYIVSDGHPVLRRDYYSELACLLGAPAPRFEPPAADSPAAERAGSDKRMNNARLLAELPVKLAYPTYREGLAAIVQRRA